MVQCRIYPDILWIIMIINICFKIMHIFDNVCYLCRFSPSAYFYQNKNKRPKGATSLTWVVNDRLLGAKKFLQIRAWLPYLFIDGHEKVEEDIEYLLPVRFVEILCSGCRGDVENVSANQSPQRPYLLTDRHEKHKLGRGPWVLAFCKVSWNSVQWLQRRCRKCLSQSEPSAAIFVDRSVRKALTW